MPSHKKRRSDLTCLLDMLTRPACRTSDLVFENIACCSTQLTLWKDESSPDGRTIPTCGERQQRSVAGNVSTGNLPSADKEYMDCDMYSPANPSSDDTRLFIVQIRQYAKFSAMSPVPSYKIRSICVLATSPEQACEIVANSNHFAQVISVREES